MTNNGINFFPSEFVTQDYFDVWYLRREPQSKSNALMNDKDEDNDGDETDRQSTNPNKLMFSTDLSKGANKIRNSGIVSLNESN